MTGSRGGWGNLHPKLKAALPRLGYERPLPVQLLAIPYVLAGYNTLVVAPTGSGKTEAAVLPLISKMLESGAGLRLVYVTPLRALNRDVVVRISKIAEAVGLRAAVRHGDTPPSERRRFLRNPPDIMVTTPESLNLLLANTYTKGVWDNVRYIVVDEIHELLESERGSELAVVLERLEKRTGRRIQRVGLSATLSKASIEWASRLLGGQDRRVIVVEDRTSKRYSVSVDVAADSWDEGAWKRLAARVAEIAESARGSVLVFVNTRSTAEKLGSVLAEIMGEEKVRVHHGSLSRSVREEAERLFREGKVKVLVATSSMELGIDIGHVELVVQFLSPRQALAMQQRAGRAGHRLSLTSKAVIVTIGNLFEVMESGVIAARVERGKIEDVHPHIKPYDALAHQIAAMVLEGSARSVDDVVEVVSATLPFAEATREEVVEVAEHLSRVRKLRISEDGALKATRKTFQYLYKVSMIPDEITYVVEDIVSGMRVGEVSEKFVERLALEDNAFSRKRPLFTLAGRVWEMLDIDTEKGRILVKPVAVGAEVVPLWEGELIPVDYKVAREVCGILSVLMVDGEDRGGLLETRKVPERARKKIMRVLAETKRLWGGRTLSASRPIVEVVGDTAIMYACLGSKGNFALGLLLSRLASSMAGSVIFDYIPYAIVFRGPARGEALGQLIRQALLEAKRRGRVERASLVYDAVKNSKAYGLRFLQVAKRLGVVEPDARLSHSMIRTIIEAYRGSLLERETLREIAHDKLDLAAMNEFIDGVDDVEIVVLDKPSPLTLEVLENPYLKRERAVDLKTIALDKLIADKRRVLSRRRVILLCVSCGHTREVQVSDIKGPESVRCPRCGRLTVAPLPASDWGRGVVEVVRKWLRGARLSKEERKVKDEAVARAMMMLNYAPQGLARKVAEALAARGVGPARARRILRALMVSGDEDRFYVEVMKAEEEYAANRRFWKTS